MSGPQNVVVMSRDPEKNGRQWSISVDGRRVATCYSEEAAARVRDALSRREGVNAAKLLAAVGAIGAMALLVALALSIPIAVWRMAG